MTCIPWSKRPQQAHSKPLTAYLNGFNGKYEIRTKIGKMQKKLVKYFSQFLAE
jgi:hypothetical protein